MTALSVFTHIADGWSDWLLEIRRVLKPGGLLIATFLDSMVARRLIGLPWDEERAGMAAFGFANPETSLPNVFHSHWWLREHWGRAFEIVELRPGEERSGSQGWAVLRAREVELTPEQLEREDPDDRRYYEARRYQFELLRAEGEELRRRHQELVQSASWRLTAPLRRAKAPPQAAVASLPRDLTIFLEAAGPVEVAALDEKLRFAWKGAPFRTGARFLRSGGTRRPELDSRARPERASAGPWGRRSQLRETLSGVGCGFRRD